MTLIAPAQDWLQELERFKLQQPEAALRYLMEAEPRVTDPAQKLVYFRKKSLLERRLRLFEAALETTLSRQQLARSLDDPIEVVRALLFEAGIHNQRGSLKEAGATLEQAVVGARETGDHGLLTEALIEQAQVLASLGDYEKAQNGLNEARAQEVVASDPALTYRLESAEATLLSYQGQPELSLDHRRKALQIARRDLPEHLPLALTNLAQNQLQMQRYTQALEGFQEALELSEDPDIVALTSLGICQFELNRFEDAIQTFDQARQKAEELGNRRLKAWAVGEKGLAIGKGRLDTRQAEPLLRASAAGFRTAGDLRNALAMEENLGVVWRDAGEWEKALIQFQRVEQEYRKLKGQQIPANLFKSMGQCLLELRRYPEAERMFDRSRVEAERSGDRKRIWQTAQLRGRLLQETGRSEEAEACYQEALATIEDARGALRLESFKTDFFEDKVRVYEDYILYLIGRNGPDLEQRTFEVAERAKARSFLDTLAEADSKLDQTLPPEILKEESRWLNTISKIQAEMRTNQADSRSADRLRAAESGLQFLYLKIRREVPAFEQFRHPSPASLSEIQESLRENEFILEFFLGQRNSYRWLVSRDEIQLQKMAPAAQIDQEVRAALTLFLDSKRDALNLGGLAHSLLGDLPEMKEGSSLLVIPSGILHYFPFEVLALEEDYSWLWRVDTSYLPSASSLRFLRHRSVVRGDPPRLLALGGPVFSSRSQVSQLRSSFGGLGALGPLPYSLEEVNQVKSIFGSSQSTTLTGSRAQESLFKAQELSRYSIVHLATHGWIDPQYPSRSGVVFGPDSGLEDGILQVREIFGLRLNAELVTLSACQTGLGRLVTGEGMVGLTRAFFYAGTDTVLATLWNINDRATTLFMKHFYSSLRNGSSKARAAREARLEMFRDGEHAHPLYWAPFVVRGLGSERVSFPPPDPERIWIWQTSLGMLAALIAIVLIKRFLGFSIGRF